MQTKTTSQIRLKSFPDGLPAPENFDLIDAPLAELKPGQVLCKTRYLSLDPYMRSQISGRHLSGSIAPGDVMRGETVAEVVASRDPGFQPGDRVRCMGGWQTYSIHDAAELASVSPDVPDERYNLSLLGMPGLTAYAGLMWQARPKAGETVVIPAATGGVGSVAGQLAKAQGCRVIGIAGSSEKCQLAVQKLGYDACINRKTEDISVRLKELCPQGVNIYFDLVGGRILEAVSQELALNARVILCGLIEDYNSGQRQPGPPPALWIIARAVVHGLVVYDFEHRRQEFIEAFLPMVRAGQIVQQHDISVGLANAPDAFCRLMRGDNNGKSLVQLCND